MGLGSGLTGADKAKVNPLEELAAAAYEDVAITEVIRPAAVLPESAARVVLVELALRDVRTDGQWWSSPTMWRRYDRPWDEPDAEGSSELIGSLQVTYGMPMKYAITIYRATITPFGAQHGWTVEDLCDEALGFGGLTLAECPRAELTPPPKPFRMN
ncbi:MAG: hypothetical protein JWO27_2809 [Frankiales bacterium]|jgi:hypothetical protein|nr:hypothetical protein [Frankiales bacterium]MCW2706432.1 hypothetical protein [Frankiales bacterium]